MRAGSSSPSWRDERQGPSLGGGALAVYQDRLLTYGNYSYSYTAKDKTHIEFRSDGLMSAVVDTHGLARTYDYDYAGRLTHVNSIDGGLTTL